VLLLLLLLPSVFTVCSAGGSFGQGMRDMPIL
jgi:hypothetical protein